MLRSCIVTLCMLLLVSSQPVYKLGSLFPTTSTNAALQSIALELTAAFQLACSQSSQLIHSNWTLSCVSSDPATVVTDGVVGAVGNILTADTEYDSGILGAFGIPLVSPGSTGNFTSASTYRFRTVTPDIYQGNALVSILQYYNWNQISVVYTTDAYATSIFNDFSTQCASRKVTILSSQSFDKTANSTVLSNIVSGISSVGSTVIVAIGDYEDIDSLMNVAKSSGLTAEGYAWLLSVDAQDNYEFVPDAFTHLQGAIALRTKSGSGKMWEGLKALWLNSDSTQYPGHIWIDDTPSPVVAQTADAVYAFVTAIDSLVKAGTEVTKTTVSSALAAVKVNGTTGLVGFDSFKDPLVPQYDVVNILGNKFSVVGSATPFNFSLSSLILWPGGSISVPSGQRNLVYKLGAVFPMDNSLLDSQPILYDLGVELLSAFRIACEVIGSNTQILSRAKLNCVWHGTAWDAPSSIYAAQVLANQSVIGYVGPIYSQMCAAIDTNVANALVLPQISPSASSTILSDRVAYPYFLRMSPSEMFQVNATIELMRYFGWKKVGTLAVGSSFFQFTVSTFVNQAKAQGFTILNSQYLNDTVDTSLIQNALNELKKAEARVIIINGFIQDIINVFAIAGSMNMTGTGYAWLGYPKTTIQTRQAFVGFEAAEAAMEGFLAIRPISGVGAMYDFLKSQWLSRDPVLYPGLLQQGRPDPITWSSETFDAVYVYAHALESMLAAGQDPTNGTQLYAALRAVNFTGAAGPEAFDKNGDPHRPVFDLVNFRDGFFTSVGKVNLAEPTNGTAFTRTNVIVWPGGSLTVPGDTYVPPAASSTGATSMQNKGNVPAPVIVLVVLLGMFALFAILFLMYIFAKERRTGKGIFIQMDEHNNL